MDRIEIKEEKHLTEEARIEVLPPPKIAYIPLSQHLGKICEPIVKIGDSVNIGQQIATGQGGIFSPIHSSISGKVTGIVDWPHPVINRCKTIVVENDGQDRLSGYPVIRLSGDIERLTSDQIRNIVFEAGIVGMGGATFPSHIKLKPPKPVDTFILNCAECEPYLTSDYRLMIEKTDEILKGLELVVKVLGVKNVFIGIEDNKPQAIELFNNALRTTHYALRVLKAQYPQGGEKQLIKSILNKEVPRGKLPFDIGIVVHNVATVFAIYEAVYLNKPLYERVVTVTGDCVSNPKNILAKVGTPIKNLIDACAPLKKEPARIIVGGPMMGLAQYTDMVPVIKSTNGILLLSEEESKILEEKFCIRCGACIRVCPVGLMPCMINLASEKEMWEQAKGFGVFDCIECGCCNYVCPSNRMMVQSIKKAKAVVHR